MVGRERRDGGGDGHAARRNRGARAALLLHRRRPRAGPQAVTAAAAGWLAVAGLGPGDAALITPEAQAALDAATDLVGYGPYVARVAPRPGLTVHASDNRVELDRARHALDLAAAGRRVVVASSGDPGVFAMASAVCEAVEAGPADWRGLDIRVLPGVTAMLAAAARVGAPLGHDFCAINLSDNLKPWALIERRLRLAVEADFALALYNPRSLARPEGFARALALLREVCEPARPMVFARAVSTPEEALRVVRLAEAAPEMADMRTVVLIGSSLTRLIPRAGRPFVYTPRSAP
ncbi:MAG: precorrin-3B C(17)-methyltransferase [Rhodobacteraceae bacterium]|nr:MAG: precorrin-3B C(17)-methyltransferase [Paracoccaceae bacterium]